MSTENVVILSFKEESKAYQAMTVLKQLSAEDRIGLRSGSVITHDNDGKLRVEDAQMNKSIGSGMLVGGLVGSFVGILGGPLGVLLAGGVGAMIGANRDLDSVRDDLSLVELIGKAIPVGSTGVIAEVSEPETGVIDTEIAKLDGSVTRRPAAEVQAEVEQAQEAETAARNEASRLMRKGRIGQLKQQVERLDEEGVVAAVKQRTQSS